MVFPQIRLCLLQAQLRARLNVRVFTAQQNESPWGKLKFTFKCPPSGCGSLGERAPPRTLGKALRSLSRLSTTWQVSCRCNNRLCLIEQAYWIFLWSEVSGVLNWMQFIVFGHAQGGGWGGSAITLGEKELHRQRQYCSCSTVTWRSWPEWNHISITSAVSGDSL